MNTPRPFATMVAAVALVLVLPAVGGLGHVARHPEPLADPAAPRVDVGAVADVAPAVPEGPAGTPAGNAGAVGDVVGETPAARNGTAAVCAATALAALFLMPSALRRAGTRAVRDGIVDAILVLESPVRQAPHAPSEAPSAPGGNACGAGPENPASPAGAIPAGAPPCPGAPRRAPRGR